MTDISDPPSNESEPNGRCICVADCKYFEYTGVKVLHPLSEPVEKKMSFPNCI